MEIKKEERLKRLEEAKKVLKSEFIGLDQTIDEIGTLITPWLLTPEILERPVIISLWGMTGTGKTSLIKRLIQLLDLNTETLVFDCGKESGGDNSDSFEDSVSTLLQDSGDVERKQEYNSIIVLDEFQHSRTIDEDGKEVGSPGFRPVWELIDSGQITANTYRYDTQFLTGFIEDLDLFLQGYKNLTLESGALVGPGIGDIKKELKYYFYDDEDDGDDEEESPVDIKKSGKVKGGNKKEAKSNKVDRFNVISGRVRRTITKCVDRRVGFGEGKKFVDDLVKEKNIDAFLEKLVSLRKIVSKPKTYNFSKSIIFIIGNLDEAFISVKGDTSPDIDADIFYEITKEVSIIDIKTALSKRFRDEQIARFGNNLIKYPTLKKEHFKEIIKKEVSRITERVKEISGKKIVCTDRVLDLLYSEGVYPTQGVRPVLSTINSILTPIISRIQMSGEDNVVIDIKDPDLCKSEVEITVRKGEEDSQVFTTKVRLSLGEIRNPEKRKTRFINAVHEMGHAIVMAYTTGVAPKMIMSVASDGGGLCVTHNSDNVGEIDSLMVMENNVMCSLAGYLAERVFFEEKRCLLGSGSDISSAWEELSYSAYRLGYLKEPIPYTNLEALNTFPGIPTGLSDKVGEVENKLWKIFLILKKKTQVVLEENKDLLVRGALLLGEKGNIGEDAFINLVEQGSKEGKNTLTVEYMKSVKENNSFDYYERVLREFKE